ncbi:hypothetical protein [Nocardia aurantiaca]|uniref:Uncharacterized protein n=1 Tax=Nocardia aurantiaca TaxID=2675850 RepID=A0A6I3L6C4_9NOCA|nr:hypothetical protein [Nocardia aurantiaca]MTE16006.1 hypothetical protein [Nocardia aurantiaca]
MIARCGASGARARRSAHTREPVQERAVRTDAVDMSWTGVVAGLSASAAPVTAAAHLRAYGFQLVGQVPSSTTQLGGIM